MHQRRRAELKSIGFVPPYRHDRVPHGYRSDHQDGQIACTGNRAVTSQADSGSTTRRARMCSGDRVTRISLRTDWMAPSGTHGVSVLAGVAGGAGRPGSEPADSGTHPWRGAGRVGAITNARSAWEPTGRRTQEEPELTAVQRAIGAPAHATGLSSRFYWWRLDGSLVRSHPVRASRAERS